MLYRFLYAVLPAQSFCRAVPTILFKRSANAWLTYWKHRTRSRYINTPSRQDLNTPNSFCQDRCPWHSCLTMAMNSSPPSSTRRKWKKKIPIRGPEHCQRRNACLHRPGLRAAVARTNSNPHFSQHSPSISLPRAVSSSNLAHYFLGRAHQWLFCFYFFTYFYFIFFASGGGGMAPVAPPWLRPWLESLKWT